MNKMIELTRHAWGIEGRSMKCPKCGGESKAVVMETRKHDGDIYRRRMCGACGVPIVTREVPTERMPSVPRVQKVKATDARKKSFDFGPLSGVFK